MAGWIFLILVSTLIIMPIYRKVMRHSDSKIKVFIGVAIFSSLICFMLLREDPRGIAGPGYLVIFLFGPFAIGWICNGIINLVVWVIARRQAPHSN